MQAPLPKRLIIFVTSKCDLRCRHCFFSGLLNNQHQDIEPENIKKLMTCFPDKLNNIIITGGEPFLNKNLPKIISFLRATTINIPTNGNNPALVLEKTEEFMCACEAIERVGICVSLDGPESLHNQIRGKDDSYKNALVTYRGLKELAKKYRRLSVGLGATVSDLNIGHLDEMAAFTGSQNEEFAFQLVRSIKQSGLPPELRNDAIFKDEQGVFPSISLEKIQHFLPQIINLYQKNLRMSVSAPGSNKFKSLINHLTALSLLRANLTTLKHRKRVLPCHAGRNIAVIYPNLDIAFCEYMRPFANLPAYNFDFAKLWSSLRAYELRKISARCFCCHTCFVYFDKYDIRKLSSLFWKGGI